MATLAWRRLDLLDPARLLRERPFSGALEIADVEAPQGAAHSGTACFVRDRAGRRYKLRACASARRAREIEILLGAAPENFPRVLRREGRLLLLEALEEHHPIVSRRELRAQLPALGAMVARLHRAAEFAGLPHAPERLRAAVRARRHLARDLRLLARRGVLERSEREAMLGKLRALRRRFGLPLAVEMDDLHKANLMLRARDGDLRYVDEEGVAVRPLLTSLASLAKSMDAAAEWEAFRAGYASMRSAAPITPEYTEYVVLIDTARKVAHKLRSGERIDAPRLEKLPDEIEDLRHVALRQVPRGAWHFRREP